MDWTALKRPLLAGWFVCLCDCEKADKSVTVFRRTSKNRLAIVQIMKDGQFVLNMVVLADMDIRYIQSR